MPGKKKNKLFNDIVDFFYSAAVFLALWIWEKTENPWLSALTFGVSMGILYYGIQKYKQRKRRILFESGIDKVDGMSGVVFEEFILEHFKHLGYSGYLTARNENYGADLVLHKEGTRTVVQAKRWKNNVGIDAIELIKAAMQHYDAAVGIVVTNSSFTESAYKLAKTSNIELWDRNKLTELINKAKLEKNSGINEAAITKE